MLTYNPKERISAINAYAHPWIQTKQFSIMNELKVKEYMGNMGKFYVLTIN